MERGPGVVIHTGDQVLHVNLMLDHHQRDEGRDGPVVAATDYVRNFAEQIRPYLSQADYTVLGTDGFGRSDTRENLRRFFEVDRNNIAYAALHALCEQGSISVKDLVKARNSLGLDPAKPNPLGV